MLLHPIDYQYVAKAVSFYWPQTEKQDNSSIAGGLTNGQTHLEICNHLTICLETKQLKYGNMKKYYDALLYTFTFILMQVVASVIVAAALKLGLGIPAESQGLATVVGSAALSGVAVTLLFWKQKWCLMSLNYMKSKPFMALLITFLLSLMIVIPITTIEEFIPERWTQNLLGDMFEELLGSFWGYIVIALVAPVSEEVVFRGGVLRRLMQRNEGEAPLTAKQRWTAIAISAACFSFIHLNPAQIPHTFLVGLLLGWLYCRTGSIIPGVIYHWANNSLAFVIVWLFPELPADAKMAELFQGNHTAHDIAFIVTAIISAVLLRMLYSATAKRAE